MEIANFLSSKLHLNLTHVHAVLRLLSEGSTIPFIARYKKEETGNMSDITLRELEEEKAKFEKLEERKKTVEPLEVSLKELIAYDIWERNEYFRLVNRRNDILKRALEYLETGK